MNTKICKDCKIVKPEIEFNSDLRMKNGYSNVCKTCKVIYNRKRRELRAAGVIPVKEIYHKTCTICNKTKTVSEFFKEAASANGYSSKCKECKTKQTYKWREVNKDKYNETARKHNRANYQHSRLQRYKLSIEQYSAMLEEQDHVCAVCKKEPPEGRPLAVDHDHTTNAVRGALCYKCNRDMVVLDDAEHMAKLLEYKHKKPST